MPSARVDLFLNLVRKDLSVRYVGSWLGYLWSIGSPLMTIFVYWFVFTKVLPSADPTFPLHLLSGMVHWVLLAQVLGASCEWLTGNSPLLRKLAFPRMLLPLGAMAASVLNWIAAPIVFLIGWLVNGQISSHGIPAYPLVLAAYFAFLLGCGLMLSVMHVWARDTRHLVDISVQVLFWMTPIVWTAQQLPASFHGWMALNPVSPFFRCFAAIWAQGRWPDSGDIPLAVLSGLATLLLGAWVFARHEASVPERL